MLLLQEERHQNDKENIKNGKRPLRYTFFVLCTAVPTSFSTQQFKKTPVCSAAAASLWRLIGVATIRGYFKPRSSARCLFARSDLSFLTDKQGKVWGFVCLIALKSGAQMFSCLHL